MVNGLSVGDQLVVSKAIKTSSGFPLKLITPDSEFRGKQSCFQLDLDVKTRDKTSHMISNYS